VNALLLALGLLSPRDTVLVELLSVSTSARMVVEAIESDSTLLLPSSALHDLLGVTSPTAWVSVGQLRTAYPTITVRWSREMNQVAVWDDLHVLPATRKFYEQHQTSARGSVPIPIQSGPFFAIAGDERSHYATDIGYNWRGRFAVQGRHSSELGSMWAVTTAPSPLLFLAYAGGDRQPAMVSARIAAGPIWVSPTWQQGRALGADGLVMLGPIKVFASTRNVYVITIQGRGGDLQVARAAGRTSARISWGPLPASPFSPPSIP